MVGRKAAPWSFDAEHVGTTAAWHSSPVTRAWLTALTRYRQSDLTPNSRVPDLGHFALRRRQRTAAWEGCVGRANRHRSVVLSQVLEGSKRAERKNGGPARGTAVIQFGLIVYALGGAKPMLERRHLVMAFADRCKCVLDELPDSWVEVFILKRALEL